MYFGLGIMQAVTTTMTTKVTRATMTMKKRQRIRPRLMRGPPLSLGRMTPDPRLESSKGSNSTSRCSRLGKTGTLSMRLE